jgi:organic hydroperoxide reductase OsmC/OhrA
MGCVADEAPGMALACDTVMAHVFLSHLEWSGAKRGPTRDPASFSRDLEVTIDGITMPMSSAPGFGGNAMRANPEQLFVAALSSCQALTFLFLAGRARISVSGYSDDAVGELAKVDGIVRMATVKLRPHITLTAAEDADQARAVVQQAHRECFIGNSVLATVEVVPVIQFAADGVPVQ